MGIKGFLKKTFGIADKRELTQKEKSNAEKANNHKPQTGRTYRRICCSKCGRPGGVKGERSNLIRIKKDTYVCGRHYPPNFRKYK